MSQSKPLHVNSFRNTSFPEFNPNPVIEFDLDGGINYLNPAVRALFPDLEEKGVDHPYLAGLQDYIAVARKEGDLNIVREIQVDQRYFEQSVSYVKELQCIRIYAIEITELMRAQEERAGLVTRLQSAVMQAKSDRAHLEANFAAQNDAVLIYDTGRNVKQANPAFLEKIGFDPVGLNVREIMQRVSCRFLDGRPLVLEEQPTPQALHGEKISVATYLITRADGVDIVVEISSGPIRLGDQIIGAITVWRDVTQRIQKEEELRKLNRTLRAISNCNQAMLRTVDETGFMDQVCKIIIEDCGHAMVWIGFAEQDASKTVRPAAYAGFEQGYLETAQITWEDNERGRGPTGTAIRNAKPCICRNMLCDPAFLPWRAEALKRGFASSIALPLLAEDKVLGALTIYSKEPDPFSADEVGLLSELANDLAYGIQSFRIRASNAQATEALRESEEKYRRLIENVNDLVCEVDVEARYRFVNLQYQEILGYAPEELLGHYVRELIHPDDLRLSTPTFKTMVDGRTISRNEWRFKHKNGAWRWFDCVAQTFEKSPGNVHVVVISRDITERKQMEQDLRRSEERYRSLFEGMTEGFALHEIVCDELGQPSDYRFLEINPSFERLTGLKRDGVVGKLHNQVLPDDDPIWVKIYGEVALTGVPVHFENYSPALKQHYEVFSYRPAPFQFAVIFLNITERKQMEEKLNRAILEAEQRAREAEEGNRILDSLLDYIPEGITIASAPDVITLKTSKFGDELLTSGWESTQGLSMQDWLDKIEHYLEDGVTPARPEDLPLWRTVKYGETIQGKELVLRRPDGNLIPVLCNAGPILDKDGKITGGIVAWRNISELKRTEDDLRRAHDELEQRVQERTEQLQTVNKALIAEIAERQQAEITIRQNSARNETLGELSHDLASAQLNLRTIYDKIVRSVAGSIGDTCSIYMLSENGEWLNPTALYNPDPIQAEALKKTLAQLPLHVEKDITDQVIQAGRSLCFAQITPQQLAAQTRPEYAQIVAELNIAHLMVVPLRQEGKTLGVLAITRDSQGSAYTPQDQELLEALADRAVLSITKARLYQDLQMALEREQQTRLQLIQAEKNSALARMVASIAHEINNPIQTINNCLFLLKEAIDPASEAAEVLNMASSESNRIGDLVARFRELYKPSKDFAVKAFNVLDVLNNVHSLLTPHLQHHNIKWKLSHDTDCALVNGIPDQLKQVFLNICLNAIDAMEQGQGKLTVAVTTSAPAQVCITFTDTGKGIKPEDMPHIFEPFYTTKEKGSGLGLSICHEIVKNFNGNISVQSQPCKGTTFRIGLPAMSY